jgi:diguanylate cyclase (GGDEF)-like protein
MRRWLWKLYAGSCVGSAGVFVVLPWSTARFVLYDLVFLSAVVMLFVGPRLHRPRPSGPWRILGIGMSLFFVRDIVLIYVLGTTAPAGALGIVDSVTIIVGLMMGVVATVRMVRLRAGGADREGVADGLAVAAATAILLWEFLVVPRLGAAGNLDDAAVSLVVFVLLQAVLVGVGGRVLFVGTARVPSAWLLFGTVPIGLASSIGEIIMVREGAPAHASWVEWAFIFYFACLGLAALHPSMVELTRPAPPDASNLPFARLAVLGLALVTSPLMILRRGGFALTALAPAVAGLLLTLIVCWRLGRLLVERDRGRRELAHQAFHDSLTGLPNRAMLSARLERAVSGAGEPAAGTLAVLLLDLDGFKAVNDSLGHDAGDRLLVVVAERLLDCVRPGDLVARLGGDEFVILLDRLTGTTEAVAVAERVLHRLAEPVLVEGRELPVRTSVGIAIGASGAGAGDQFAQDLLRDADVAMYYAKRQGTHRWRLFEPAMRDDAMERLTLEADLQHALERDEFVLLYQPVVELDSGRIVGAEALLRWRHPTRGLLPPAAFLPLVEELGLMVPVGYRVLHRACAAAVLWPGGPVPPTVSVNLSGTQLADPGLVAQVNDALRATGLPPRRLTLELTESLLVDDTRQNLAALAELRALGIRLAIDDFGTGYSSLSYLRQFPVDQLKIDKSFVEGIPGDQEASALAEAILALATALRLQPVAEGLETTGQLAALRALRCQLGQGELFARPLPEADLVALLERGGGTLVPAGGEALAGWNG